MLEVNPLVRTGDDKFVALDAKVTFDDNALYRHPDYAELRDLEEEEPLEIEASKVRPKLYQTGRKRRLYGQRCGLGDGNDGRDSTRGGKPANFLDVGGGANVHRISNAFPHHAFRPECEKQSSSISLVVSCAATVLQMALFKPPSK